MTRSHISICLAWAIIAALGAVVGAAEPAEETMAQWRERIATHPPSTLRRLNEGGFDEIVASDGLEVADALAVEAIAAAARETWPVEQLQRRRIQAMLRAGKKQEALSAAKALFLVSGIGSTPYCVRQLCECIEQADARGKVAVNLFKKQQLALASSDPELRKKQSADLGPNVLAGIAIDPKPFEKAIAELKERDDYYSAYARGNLLLLSGRVAEAREAFETAYQLAPAAEFQHASEGLAKVVKAEDLSIGRMNQFILSLRPGK